MDEILTIQWVKHPQTSSLLLKHPPPNLSTLKQCKNLNLLRVPYDGPRDQDVCVLTRKARIRNSQESDLVFKGMRLVSTIQHS